MLFDEKMGDTVHMAVGAAYPETVGEGNDSAKHVDMIVDMSEDPTVELGGEVVQRDGRFVFEEHFDEVGGRARSAGARGHDPRNRSI